MSEPRSTITRISEGGAIGAGLGVIAGTDTNKQAKLPGAASVRILGVTITAVDAAGKPQGIYVGGIAACVAKSAIAVGDLIEVAGTDGKFQKANPASGVNAFPAGMAFTSASAENDVFYALIAPSTMQGQ